MLTKVGEFLKKNWLAVVLVVGIVFAAFWMRNQQADYAQAIKDLNDSHQVEIRKINEARAQEAKEHEEQLRQLQENVARIEADYKQALVDLQKERAARKNEIVRKYGNDADGLANLLAGEFGFTVKPAQ